MTPFPHGRFHVRLLDSMDDLPEVEWQALFDEHCENQRYFTACEQAPAPGFRYQAVAVYEGNRPVAGAPLFQVTLETARLLEGPFRHLVTGMGRLLPGIARVRLLGIGSPHVDELPLVFANDLDSASRQAIVLQIIQALDRHARRQDCHVVLWKNLDEQSHRWMGPVLRRTGHAPISGLPIAMLEVPASDEAYIAGLSANMRSNLRRKLKRAAGIRVEIRRDTGGLDAQLHALREQTRQRANTDYDVFEHLSPDYFSQVLRHDPEHSRLFLYWHHERLLGFALAVFDGQQLREKYTGLHYPEALDHGIFFLNWMTLLRFCREHGIAWFRAGETTYLTKVRLGCTLQPSWLWARHRNPLTNRLLRLLSRQFDLDRNDPDLLRLGATASCRERTAP